MRDFTGKKSASSGRGIQSCYSRGITSLVAVKAPRVLSARPESQASMGCVRTAISQVRFYPSFSSASLLLGLACLGCHESLLCEISLSCTMVVVCQSGPAVSKPAFMWNVESLLRISADGRRQKGQCIGTQ
jgi:hypothetical protein